MQGDTKPPARDAAVPEQLRYDAFDGCGRNGNDLAARPEGRHAETRASGVVNGTALLAAGKTDIEHDAPVNEATVAAMPFGAGEIDEPHTRARATSSVCSDRQRNCAGMRLARGDRWRRNRFCQPQDRDISARIASGNLGRQD